MLVVVNLGDPFSDNGFLGSLPGCINTQMLNWFSKSVLESDMIYEEERVTGDSSSYAFSIDTECDIEGYSVDFCGGINLQAVEAWNFSPIRLG